MQKLSSLLIVAGFLVMSGASCQKELSCENCAANQVPVAEAGADQWVRLPKDSVVLDGKASKDPDGRIVMWTWKKISGPTAFQLNKPSDSVSAVKKLTEGRFEFELTVKDDGGLTAKDTVSVTVVNPWASNRPPVAHAGNDTTILLPSNVAVLDGRRSTDPDFNIMSYKWTLVSGPPAYKMKGDTIAVAEVSELAAGIYDFSLLVTDSAGLADLDTVRVKVEPGPVTQVYCDTNRPVIKARLVPVGKLSVARDAINVASAGGKILFAGGGSSYLYNGNVVGNVYKTDVVDIFDIGSNTWSTARLCTPRSAMAAISSGNKIFFAGGEIADGNSFALVDIVDSVDIYDVSTNTWSVAHLSTPGVAIATVALGNKVFFAGGYNVTDGGVRGKRVDIYDASSGTWSTARLSYPKEFGLGAVVTAGKVFFAGGGVTGVPIGEILDIVDVYDETTKLWSTRKMVEPRSWHAGIAASGKIFWAGGLSSSGTPTCQVEIFDVRLGESSVSNLFKPGKWYSELGQKAVLKNDKIVLFRHNDDDNRHFDIYDTKTGVWSIGEVDLNIKGSSIIAVDNVIYIAGGAINGVLTDQVWKLEF